MQRCAGLLGIYKFGGVQISSHSDRNLSPTKILRQIFLIELEKTSSMKFHIHVLTRETCMWNFILDVLSHSMYCHHTYDVSQKKSSWSFKNQGFFTMMWFSLVPFPNLQHSFPPNFVYYDFINFHVKCHSHLQSDDGDVQDVSCKHPWRCENKMLKLANFALFGWKVVKVLKVFGAFRTPYCARILFTLNRYFSELNWLFPMKLFPIFSGASKLMNQQ